MSGPTIAEFLHKDHERLNALMDRCLASLESGSPDTMRDIEELRQGLVRHLLWEEEILLPLYIRNAPPEMAAKAVTTARAIRAEHRTIERMANELVEKLRLRLQDARAEAVSLRALIVRHEEWEERELYPEFDRAAGMDISHVLRSIDDLSDGKGVGG